MRHAGAFAGGQQLCGGPLEEVADLRVVEDRRVGGIHHHLCALQCSGQALAGQHVHAGAARRRYRFVPVRSQMLHHPTADQPVASDDDDLHV